MRCTNSFLMASVSTLALLLGGAAVATAEPVQWRAEDGGNGHWYELVVSPTVLTFYDAEAAAEARDGYLVTVTSQAETNFIVAALGGNNIKCAWLGAYQDRTDPAYSEPAGGWKWITGELWSYTDWCPVSGEPNNVGGHEEWANFHGDFSTGVWCDITWNQPNQFKYVMERSVPEPGSMLMLLTGAVGLLAYAWRRTKRAM
jgi:hypothetical protein